MHKLVSKNAHLFILVATSFIAIFTTHPAKWFLVVIALIVLRQNILGVLKKNFFIFFSWILYLIYCGASLLWTISVPISLSGLLDQIGYFLYFVYVLIICEKFGRMKVFVAMSTYIVVLISINIVLLLLPVSNQLGGSTDFLLPAYGHNHLSSVVLLVLPAAFYLINKKLDRLGAMLIIFSLISLISSSGRILLFLGLIEIIVSFILLIRTNHLTNKIKILFLSSIIVISATIFWFLIFSTKVNVCYGSTSWWCKPLEIGARKSYLSVAVKNLIDEPLLGTGLNTYSLIARKYTEQPGVYSHYAHNYLLQIITELGTFGFLVFTLLFTTILTSIRNSKNSNRLEQFLVIGLLFNFFNALLDYDWNTSTSFLLALMVLGIVISKSSANTNKAGKFLFISNISSLLVVIRLLVFVLSFFILIYITQAVLIAINKPDYACLVFAGNKQAYELLLSGKNNKISTDCVKKVDNYFINDLYYWQYKNDNAESESDRINAHYNLIRLSPWHSLAGSTLDFYIENNQRESAEKYINLVIENTRRLKKTNSLKHWQLYKLTPEIVRFGDYLFSQKEYGEAGAYHRIAYELDPWALSFQTPIIANRVAMDGDEYTYYEHLRTISPEYFRSQAGYYSDYYLSLAIMLSGTNSESTQLIEITKSASQLTDTINLALWYRLLWTIEGDPHNPLSNYDNHNQRSWVFMISDEMTQILKRNSNISFFNELDREESMSIAKYLTNLGRISLSDNQIDLAYNLSWSATKFIDEKSPAFSQTGLLCENVMDLTCAEKEYRNCLAVSQQLNQECSEGLARIVNNIPDRNRYWSITEKLLLY
ncbi:MAG TPA: O-antigen ligase family protein [Candidatus Woesebacteria bacterium]|nr:O-antigen ligase family protein [Candidatus Woesebacteria bacterium]